METSVSIVQYFPTSNIEQFAKSKTSFFNQQHLTGGQSQPKVTTFTVNKVNKGPSSVRWSGACGLTLCLSARIPVTRDWCLWAEGPDTGQKSESVQLCTGSSEKAQLGESNRCVVLIIDWGRTRLGPMPPPYHIVPLVCLGIWRSVPSRHRTL